jgi:general secretion pathway protein N
MSSIGRTFGVGCFLLVATASAFGVVNPAGLNVTQSDDASAEGLQPAAAAQASLAAQTARSGNPLWGIPLKLLSATRERPIFSASRRPPPINAAPPAVAVAPPVQAPKPPERPQLSLVGTIVNGDDGIAIFLDQNTRAPLRIRMGAGYQGWMLRGIEARSVTLQKGDDIAVLDFPPPSSNPTIAAGTGLAQLPPITVTPPAAAQAAPFLSPESKGLRMPVRQQRGGRRQL